MLTLTIFSWCSSAMRSRTGATAWHGPHHSAQKSTMTLPSEERTSVSNVSVVALVAICSFQRGLTGFQTPRSDGFFPHTESYDRNVFTKLSDKPDHPAIEVAMLELWEREGTFERLRAQNRGG